VSKHGQKRPEKLPCTLTDHERIKLITKSKKKKNGLENIFPPGNKNKRLQRIVSPKGKEKYLFGLNIYKNIVL
jgi:hypothetical protein